MSRPSVKPKVLQLDKTNCFVTKVSTNTTERYGDIAFLRAKTRITPIENKKTYKDEILQIKDCFMMFAKQLMQDNLDYSKKYILSVNVAEDSVKFHKISHLHYDLFINSVNQHTFLQHKRKLQKISNKLEKKLISLFKKYNFNWK